MIIYPAIDILGGQCVRLFNGRYDEVKKYDVDPLRVAASFVQDGAEFLHIIDLDGAKEGKPINFEKIAEIASTFNVPVQVGGGIRNFKVAKDYLENGVERLIFGTSAVKNPGLISEIIADYSSKNVVISLDVDNGQIATNGWRQKSSRSLDSLIEEFSEVGVNQFVVTDINSDGAMNGPNFALYENLCNRNLNIIAAGGISNMDDLMEFERLGLSGAIVGKAIYERTIDLGSAVSLLRSNLAKRIIPCLDIRDGRTVKGTNFKNLRDAGDPVELASTYCKMGADELVFLDITATVEKRKTLVNLVRRIAENICIPFTVGGGIYTIEDIDALLSAGADKISLGSAAFRDPYLVHEAARKFGSQCIVISLDCAWNNDFWEIYIKGGREATGANAVSFAKKMASLGAGELLVNSLDRDGTEKGYDLELLKSISSAVNIPIIASSGAGCKLDFLRALTEGKADGALAASLFHYEKIAISEVKDYLKLNNIAVRT